MSFEEVPPPEGATPWVVAPRPQTIAIVEHDPAWPRQAAAASERIRGALGTRAIRIEHVGSTAVPGLAAKPVIDLDLTLADPSAERVWLPRLEHAGFVLTVREPWWYEHRLLQAGTEDNLDDVTSWAAVNLHVFGPDSPELIKHIVFRDWLRANRADRDLYEGVKRAAASVTCQRVIDYNARKQAIIRDIYERAFTAAGLLDSNSTRNDLPRGESNSPRPVADPSMRRSYPAS